MDGMKEKIIYTAAESFKEKGFRKVTLDKIAYDLGISKKTLYKHFKSKDELIRSVIEQLKRNILAADRTTMEDADISWEDKIFKIVFGPQGLSPQENVMFEEMMRYYPQEFKALVKIKRDCIEELLGRETEKGSTRPEINPKVVVMNFLHAMEHLFSEENFLYETRSNMIDTLEMVGDIILNGIKKKA
jgi:AcrR family transcriptional regulator